MSGISFNKIGKGKQYAFSAAFIILVACICFALSSVLEYRVVGYILLISVSLVAMVFDILPVFIAALLSAIIWDFFFIPPHFTLHIGTNEDTVLLLLYFIIAMVNAVLTHKIRKMEKAAIHKEEKGNTLKLYGTLLNSLSHELRTPIATIIAATDNLQTTGTKLTVHDRHELTKEIAKASFRLNQQVDNLLNMSRLESGHIQPRKDWCDINDMVYSTVKRIEENKITQKINISINPELPFFKLDKGMLEQVLYNLLNNAVLYTPADANVNIQAVAHTDVLELRIEDNGNGFPPEEIGQVFNKFYRLKNSRTGGTGLGLSIVKGFVEAMGGDVVLENATTGGAKFTVRISAETSYIKNLKHE
ncbi:MAG: DUF4118 domain-containing protein [Chitinophagaceae bacterium]|nr:MAG: DUF4118 domain-containing protein [Chitinophagaceae bacterium]